MLDFLRCSRLAKLCLRHVLRRPSVLPAALAMLLSGCATGGGGVSMVATIAGGERVPVPLGRNGVVPTTQDGVQIEAAVFTLNPEKKLVYLFAFSDAKARPLQNVRVEDMSDDAPVLLVEEGAPTLSEGRWRGASRPFNPGDPALAWMATITNSLRVFRFTLTFADGRKLVLLQGSMFPSFMKAGVRQAWGERN